MSYFHCGNGYPDRCNGYKGPLDASVCTSGRHKYDDSGRQVTAQPGPPLVCACGHNITVHWVDAGGCQKCDCTGYRRSTDDRAPITYYRDENRPVEVGTLVYDADGQVVAQVTHVAADGSITIRAPRPEGES